MQKISPFYRFFKKRKASLTGKIEICIGKMS